MHLYLKQSPREARPTEAICSVALRVMQGFVLGPPFERMRQVSSYYGRSSSENVLAGATHLSIAAKDEAAMRRVLTFAKCMFQKYSKCAKRYKHAPGPGAPGDADQLLFM